MNVLIISDSFEGGGAEAVFRDTLDVCSCAGYITDSFVAEQKIGPLSYIFSPKNYLRLKKKLNTFRPDIIHLHNYYHFLTPSILLAIRQYKTARKCRVVYTAHDFHLICPNSGFQHFSEGKRINFSAERNNLQLNYRFDHRSWMHSLLKVLQHVVAYRILRLRGVFDVIITPGEFMKTVMRRYGISCPIAVVRNPVTLPEYSRSAPAQGQQIHLVFAGRLSPEKGLLEFLEKLNKECTQDFIFHIYGEGELENKLRALVSSTGLSIILHGRVERSALISEISQYDVFVLPSIWYENAPVSLIEAAAAGLPVVVPGYGGMQEMAWESQHSFLFDYDDEGLSDILRRAARYRGQNRLIRPAIFTYDHYRMNIRRVYQP